VTAEETRALGYFLLPIPAGRKEPPPAGWLTRAEPYEVPAGGNVAIGVRGEIAILITNDERSTSWATEQFGKPHVRSVRGAHWYFRARKGQANESNKETPVGAMELHVRNKYALIPPSIHPSGAAYGWVRPLPKIAELPECPDLRELWHPSGSHHSKLLAMSSAKARAGAPEEQIAAELRAYRDSHLRDSAAHPDRELEDMARSAVEKFGRSQAAASLRETGPTEGAPDYIDLFDENGKPQWDAFIAHLESEFHFSAMRDTGELLVYRGGVYEPDGRQTVNEWVECRFRERSLRVTTRSVDEIIGSIRRAHLVPREQFNPSGFLPVSNGVLDLRTPTTPAFGDHDPARRFTFKIAVPFEVGARCPGFEALVARALPREEARATVQEEFGYTLTPGNPHKTAFFWVGPPDSMKSTLQAVLRGMLGNKNVTAISLQLLSGDNRFASSGLYGKLANLVADLPIRSIRDVGTFKMLVGGDDEVPAERKFMDQFSFRNLAKLFYSANELPAVPWADEAFFRRWILTEFAERIPLEEQVEGVASRLVVTEGPGILNWSLAGLVRLKKRGRFDPKALEGARVTWRRHSNSLVAYVEDRLEVVRTDPVPHLPKDELWNDYIAYCDERDLEPVAKNVLGTELPRLAPGIVESFPKFPDPNKSGKLKTVRSWRGARIRGVAVSTLSTGSTGDLRISHPRAREVGVTGQSGVEGVEGVEQAVAAEGRGPDLPERRVAEAAAALKSYLTERSSGSEVQTLRDHLVSRGFTTGEADAGIGRVCGDGSTTRYGDLVRLKGAGA
jgi:P4 family phage/plasmid primase-like protien